MIHDIQFFLGLLTFLVESGGILGQLGSEIGFGSLEFPVLLFNLLNFGVQPRNRLVTGLNPLGQGNPFAFGVGFASIIGVLALGPKDEPCGGHADGEADEEKKDGEDLVHDRSQLR